MFDLGRTADELIGLFAVVLHNCQIKSINAEIAFIERFMPKRFKQNMEGYYISMIVLVTSTDI